MPAAAGLDPVQRTAVLPFSFTMTLPLTTERALATAQLSVQVLAHLFAGATLFATASRWDNASLLSVMFTA